jgi:hypothetical protein
MRFLVAACLAAFAVGGVASAQTTYYWTGGSGTWSNSALWSTTLSATTAANAVPDLTTDVVAPMTTATSTAITFTLTADGSARSLSFLPSFTQSCSFAAASPFTFTLGAGGLLTSSGAFNSAANVGYRLAESQAWRFNGSSTINGGISRADGAVTNQSLYISGSAVTTAVNLLGPISDGGSGGSLGLTFGRGTHVLSNTNSYTGVTLIQDGGATHPTASNCGSIVPNRRRPTSLRPPARWRSSEAGN